jgi:hypothetical protein
MLMKNYVLTMLLAFIALLTFSCSDDNEESGDATGRLIVKLTDAPFPYELVSEVNVTIFKIDARNTSMDEMDEEDPEAGEDAGSPFVVLMEEEVEVNLLDLTNGVTETLVNQDFPVGNYDLVRIYVKGVNVVLTDGTTYDLTVPSGAQTGIKVFITPGLTVEGGLTSELLLDFDVSRSFIPQGNLSSVSGITGFNFKPVIKASNVSTTGTLGGTVTTTVEETVTPLEGAQISVFTADTLNTTTFTDVEGAYTIMGLAAGTYEIMVELEGYASQEAEGIQITAANKTTQDFELTASEE